MKPGAGKTVFKRVRFNEITKKAVLAAMDDAGEIDGRRVDAQQARRIIDRLVGYEVSDLLWKKIWRGLSAGRVQTVALRIICERENEIEAFVPVEYWTLDATLEGKTPPPFTARLSTFDGEKLKFDGTDPRLPNEAAASRVREDVANAVWKVASVESSERRKNPAPPFITSQLQQAAARRLGFAVRRTMQIAQRLYEGREIPGRGTVGLITYMRTDSTRVSQEALTAVREHIGAHVPEGVAARVAALLQEPPRHAGRARGDPPDVPGPSARGSRQARRGRRGQALPAHLAALRGLADGARPSTTRRRPRSRRAARSTAPRARR